MSASKIVLPVCSNAAAKATQQARWQLSAEHLARRDEVLTFWFGKKFLADNKSGEDAVPPNDELWWFGTKEIDAEIKSKFTTDVEKATAGEYESWTHDSPHSLLALIILLDQFPMHIYRDEPQGYKCSEKAIPLAYTAIGRKWNEDPRIHNNMRLFFTLPLMHSEKLDDQCWMKNIDPEDCCVVSHHAPIEKYGRFPGRNKVFSRESTDEEKKYIEEGGEY